MNNKYKNNFPEVEAFLWDGDIEKAKEFFGDGWGSVAQYKEQDNNRLIVMGLASDPFCDTGVTIGNYIIHLKKDCGYLKMNQYDFEGNYTKI